MVESLSNETTEINLNTRHPGKIIYLVQAEEKDGENKFCPVEERDFKEEYERDDWFEAEADRWL